MIDNIREKNSRLPEQTRLFLDLLILKEELGIKSWLTDDIDVERVSDAAVLVPDYARVVAVVECVGFRHPDAVPSVDPRYL